MATRKMASQSPRGHLGAPLPRRWRNRDIGEIAARVAAEYPIGTLLMERGGDKRMYRVEEHCGATVRIKEYPGEEKGLIQVSYRKLKQRFFDCHPRLRLVLEIKHPHPRSRFQRESWGTMYTYGSKTIGSNLGAH